MRVFIGMLITLLALPAVMGLPAAADDDVTKIVFVAGRPSHPPKEHEHRAGCMLLAKSLEAAVDDVETDVYSYGWPKDESFFDGADAIVVYCDGGAMHPMNRHLEFVDGLMKKGVGLVCLHYAVETVKGKEGDKFLEWMGGYFEPNWSVNPHWRAKFETLPDHEITRGVPPFVMQDEWYYHMRFAPQMEGVTPILTDLPPKSTLSRPDGPHEGNPAVREAIANGERQHVAWAYEREGDGRGFGFTGGHFHRNWQDDDFRKLVLNAILWTAHHEVPENGVESPTPSDEDMLANLDDKGRRR